MIACENPGYDVSYDFSEVRKIVNASVITNEEFAIFQNAGYMGLYGGMDVDDIHERKQLEVGQKILDFVGRFARAGKKYTTNRKRTDGASKSKSEKEQVDVGRMIFAS